MLRKSTVVSSTTYLHQNILLRINRSSPKPRCASRGFSALTWYVSFLIGAPRSRKLCLDAIVEALSELARVAESENLIIGLENEHACNVATAAELVRGTRPRS